MIELKCKGSVEYAEKIEIQARETFGDCGILIGRDGDKVRMEVSYVNDQFDERDFVEFLKSVDCTIPMDSIFYLNEGVVWKKDAYKLCYMKKEELPSIIEQNMFAGEMLSALFFVRVIVDLDMLDEIDFDALVLIHLNLSMLLTSDLSGKYIKVLNDHFEKIYNIERPYSTSSTLDKYAA